MDYLCFFFFIYKFKTKIRKRMNLNLFKNTIFYSLSLNYERWICWCSRVFFFLFLLMNIIPCCNSGQKSKNSFCFCSFSFTLYYKDLVFWIITRSKCPLSTDESKHVLRERNVRSSVELIRITLGTIV
jgi:hypothetical protein